MHEAVSRMLYWFVIRFLRAFIEDVHVRTSQTNKFLFNISVKSYLKRASIPYNCSRACPWYLFFTISSGFVALMTFRDDTELLRLRSPDVNHAPYHQQQSCPPIASVMFLFLLMITIETFFNHLLI